MLASAERDRIARRDRRAGPVRAHPRLGPVVAGAHAHALEQCGLARGPQHDAVRVDDADRMDLVVELAAEPREMGGCDPDERAVDREAVLDVSLGDAVKGRRFGIDPGRAAALPGREQLLGNREIAVAGNELAPGVDAHDSSLMFGSEITMPVQPGRDAMRIVPPWSNTHLCTIVSPSPVPFGFVV